MRYVDMIPRVAYDQRDVLVERAAKMNGDETSIDTVFRLVPESTRDLLAHDQFTALVREQVRRDARAA